MGKTHVGRSGERQIKQGRGELPSLVPLRDGNGRGGFEGWGFRARPIWFCLTSSPPNGKNFLAPSLLIRALQSLIPFHKTILLVNLLTIITIVFNKTYFVNKNNLKLQINLSHQIKLIFSKN